MSSSNYCFLTCLQISQEAGQVVWYSHLFKNFPQFVVRSSHNSFVFVLINWLASSPSVYLHLPILSYWKDLFQPNGSLISTEIRFVFQVAIIFFSGHSPLCLLLFHSPNNFFLPLNILSWVIPKGPWHLVVLYWFCTYHWQPNICNICYVCPFWKGFKVLCESFFFFLIPTVFNTILCIDNID